MGDEELDFAWGQWDTDNGGRVDGPRFEQVVDCYGHQYTSAIGARGYLRPAVVRWQLRKAWGGDGLGAVRIGVILHHGGPPAEGDGADWELAGIQPPRLGVTRRCEELFPQECDAEDPSNTSLTSAEALRRRLSLGNSFGSGGGAHLLNLSLGRRPQQPHNASVSAPPAALRSCARDDCDAAVWYLHYGGSGVTSELRRGRRVLPPIMHQARPLRPLQQAGATVTVTLCRITERVTWSLGVEGDEAGRAPQAWTALEDADEDYPLALYLSIRQGGGAWDVVSCIDLTPIVVAAAAGGALCLAACAPDGVLPAQWWARRGALQGAEVAAPLAAACSGVLLVLMRGHASLAASVAAPAAVCCSLAVTVVEHAPPKTARPQPGRALRPGVRPLARVP
eukprot:TRINITY_DN65203_c0_g1_i1.p1 TRINITY_DN65203_c0_g1~~TRINITY_DN65203_c0_g1_i1.p1  ORF type:complete len:394 (+),score=106.12 TRINITY_DN65203_c0_g1_i1:72-1253(+)